MGPACEAEKAPSCSHCVHNGERASGCCERPGLKWTLACLRGPQIHCRIIIRAPMIGADERASHRTRALLCIITRRYLFLTPPCCILISDRPPNQKTPSAMFVCSIYFSACSVCGCFCQLFRPGFGLMRVKLPAENRNEVANLNCPLLCALD